MPVNGKKENPGPQSKSAKISNSSNILGESFRYDWQDLVYFLELARHGQLVGTARRLKVDHTTVSRRIRKLEQALNSQLFSRTPRGFVLTETGLKLLEHVEAMEYRAHAIAQTVGIEGTEAGGTVRIGTMEGIGSLYLGPRILNFHECHPSILIELVTAPRWINLSKREADIFISFPKPEGKRLVIREIGKFRIGLYASKDYLVKNGTPKRKPDLDKHGFVDYIDDLIEIGAVRWLGDIVSRKNVVFRSSSLIAQFASASAGLGIAALPTFVAVHNSNLIPVLPRLSTTRDIWLSVHEDLLQISRVKAVERFLEQQISDDQKFLLSSVNG